MPGPDVFLHLSHSAESAWTEVIRPWLQEEKGLLSRRHLVVPTRGQAHGLKQRCLMEGVALLGVEFLTPGLGRKKWLSASVAEQAPWSGPAIGRELLLFGLHLLIERRLRGLSPEEPHWGFWKSLQSDADRALDDFDAMLKAGFRAEHFATVLLRELFHDLETWVAQHGYAWATLQNEAAALAPRTSGQTRIADRLLVYGFSAECWGEFFNLAALARRFEKIVAVLPAPEFSSRRALDEKWTELWRVFLGVEPVLLEPAINESCDAVASLWTAPGTVEPAQARRSAQMLVGKSRGDEMRLVATEIERLLARGAGSVGVVFPEGSASHLLLAELLAKRDVPFVNLNAQLGAVGVEVKLQCALLKFYECGGRLEELLHVWPLLRVLGHANISIGAARAVCEQWFDLKQTHALSVYRELWESAERDDAREFGRVASLLLPAWPSEIPLADALGRFETLNALFGLPEPPGWAAVRTLAARETAPVPLKVVVETLKSFLPETSLARGAATPHFARVVLTTRRRAEALTWDYLVFVEANAGVWPRRPESSCWLPDEERERLNLTGRFSLGLFTAEDLSTLERASYASLARDTRVQVYFTASLFSEEDLETKRAPNVWLERWLWAIEPGEANRVDVLFENAAVSREQASGAGTSASLAAWSEVWKRRRDPAKPLDEYSLSVDPTKVRPARLAARLIERAVQDPAELWFEAVLGARRVEWRPLVRARRKSLGQLAHRVLAAALQGEHTEAAFRRRPEVEKVQELLTRELESVRHSWPRDRYWDSFYAELVYLCHRMLPQVFSLSTGDYIGVEAWLPPGATVPLGALGAFPVYGRVDLIFADQPQWTGARVDIVDFKTGVDAELSARRMAETGASLQLGVYLAAAQSVGATAGRVWMVKPDLENATHVEFDQLTTALLQLEQLGRHIQTGHYGALTPDRSDYAPEGFRWPVACVRIPYDVWRRKHELTFGDSSNNE